MKRAAVVLALVVTGCAKNDLVDIAMSGSRRPAAHGEMRVAGRLVLAGDMHCHVLPPDAPSHVSRDLAETIARAKSQGLDFVVLTPHVPARFFMNDEARGWVLRTQQRVRGEIARLHPDLVVVPGFEYTDRRYGHVGVSFADVAEVLASLAAEEAEEHPERFFEQWLAHGGILTINHPVNRPLPNAPFVELKADMSWRAFDGLATPPEVTWLTTHAQAIETFNASISHLRDQFLVGEEDRSLRESAHLVDRTSRAQHRRITAVGGSDSHGRWLRATTFVLARERSLAALREGIVAGRTCVRGPEACSLQVRSTGSWIGLGDSMTTDASWIEARASGDEVTYVVNGEIAKVAPSGAVVSLPIPADRCTIIRAIVGRSWSSGAYVNCQLAP